MFTPALIDNTKHYSFFQQCFFFFFGEWRLSFALCACGSGPASGFRCSLTLQPYGLPSHRGRRQRPEAQLLNGDLLFSLSALRPDRRIHRMFLVGVGVWGGGLCFFFCCCCWGIRQTGHNRSLRFPLLPPPTPQLS